jgi:hypothetical protein
MGLVAGALIAAAAPGAVRAVNFANVVIDVTVTGSASISFIGVSTTTFGNVAVSSQAISGAPIVVRNDSAGVILKYGLKSYNSTPWTLAANPGVDAYAISGLFNANATAGAPVLADFVDATDAIFPDNVLIYATDVVTAGAGSFEGTAPAALVNPGVDLKMWFKLRTPTVSSSIGTRTLTVTVQGDIP